MYFIYLYVRLPPAPPRKCKLYGARELSLFCSLLRPQYLDLCLVYARNTVNEWISPSWYFCHFMQTLSTYIKIYLYINICILRKLTHIFWNLLLSLIFLCHYIFFLFMDYIAFSVMNTVFNSSSISHLMKCMLLTWTSLWDYLNVHFNFYIQVLNWDRWVKSKARHIFQYLWLYDIHTSTLRSKCKYPHFKGEKTGFAGEVTYLRVHNESVTEQSLSESEPSAFFLPNDPALWKANETTPVTRRQGKCEIVKVPKV